MSGLRPWVVAWFMMRARGRPRSPWCWPEVDGFGVIAAVGKDRLAEALGHARKQLSHPSEATFQRKLLDLLADLESRQQTPQRIVIKADGEIVCLKPNEIDWAESAGNYVCL